MSDSDNRVFDSQPAQLADLLALAAPKSDPWRPEELKAILLHQLATPIEFEIAELDHEVAGNLRKQCEADGPLIRSFLDVLHCSDPPLALLKLTKDYAKANQKQPRSPLPARIAGVLYYASIAAALVRCGVRITSLPDEELCSGLRTLTEEPWLDTETKNLLTEAQKLLSPATSGRPRPP